MEIVVPVHHFPPWKIVKNNRSSFEGIDLQLITDLVERYNQKYSTSHTLKYNYCPWIRCLKMMEDGSADLLSGVQDKVERRVYLEYLNPPYKESSKKAFYYNRKRPLSINTYEELYKYSIGAVNGSFYFSRFDSDKKLDKRFSVDHKRLVDMLLKGRFDLMIGTESQMDYLLSNEMHTKQIMKASYIFDKATKVYFTVSKRSKLAKQVERLNSVARELLKEGVFSRIISDNFNILTN